MEIRRNAYLEHGIELPLEIKPNAKGNIHVVCPECSKTRTHREKAGDPVLGVHIEKECWRCNHCGWTGSLRKKKELNKEFKERLSKVVKKTNFGIDHPVVKWFWEKRRISYDVLKWSRVFVANQTILIKRSSDPKQVGKWVNKECLNFPFIVNGECVALKFRDSQKNFGAISGGNLMFYGLDDIQHDDWCIITEGEIDKISWMELGIPNVISVPNGVQITNEERKKIINGETVESHMNLEYVDNSFEYLQHIKKFIIATDDDPPGIKLRNELARRLGKHRCLYMTYHGKKDTNQVLVESGKEELQKCLEEAREFPIEHIIVATDVWDELEFEYKHGKQKGLSLGWKSLDPHWTIRKGDFIVGNGYTGNGKTMFSLNIVAITTVLYDWKWSIYSPENYPERRIFDYLAEIIIGNTSDLDSNSRMLLKDYRAVIRDFLSKRIYVVSDSKRYTPVELNNIFSELIARYGITGCLKDPWNSLKHNTKGNLDEYLENALSEEVSYAIKNDVCSIVNAHPPTPVRTLEKRYPAPSKHEIRGGTIWPSKAYVQYCIHRPDDGTDSKTTQLFIQKVKDHKLVGLPTPTNDPVVFEYERRSNRYYEIINERGGIKSHPLSEYKSIVNQQLKFEI